MRSLWKSSMFARKLAVLSYTAIVHLLIEEEKEKIEQ
jgi:hypothetical protein